MYGQTTTEALDQSFIERFNNAMCDDFNTAEAMAVLFELNKELNRAVKKSKLTKRLCFIRHYVTSPTF